MKKIYYYIYETTNLINGKTYIGQHVTENLDDGYMGSGQNIRRAFKKYGKQNFKKEILMFVVNQVALNFIEKCLVTVDFINDDQNYNLKEGGGSTGRWSEDVKRKISEKAKGRKCPEVTRLGVSKRQKGRIVSIETREKLRQLRLGSVNDAVRRANMSRGIKASFTDERKKQISIFRKDRPSYSKPFPTLINIHTGEVIPSGNNLKKECRDRNITYNNIASMIRGVLKTSQGWKILTRLEGLPK